MAMFRRSFMGLFNEVHHLVDMEQFDGNHPRVIDLPRSAAEELVLASVLVPLFQTNIAASFGDYIFSTDASDSKGAICSAGMDPQLQEVVFRACKSKGSYTRLQRSEEAILRRIGAVEGFDEEPLPCSGLRRPICSQAISLHSGSVSCRRQVHR